MTRQEAIEWFRGELKDGKCSDSCPQCNANEIALRTLETFEKKGHWIAFKDKYLGESYRCSECGFIMPTEFRFCPYCGAEMEVDNEHTN